MIQNRRRKRHMEAFDRRSAFDDRVEGRNLLEREDASKRERVLLAAAKSAMQLLSTASSWDPLWSLLSLLPFVFAALAPSLRARVDGS